MKTFTKKIIVALMMLLCSINVSGQENPSIIEHEIFPNWYYIDDEYPSDTRSNISYLTKRNFISTCKSEFDLTDDDELIVVNTFYLNDINSSLSSIRNNRISKYQQYYKGYKVKSSIIITQDMSDTINLVLGELVGNLNIDTSNPISRESAVATAINALDNIPIYMDNTIINEWCYDEDGNFDTLLYNSLLPQSELCISKISINSLNNENFCFVWEINVSTIENDYSILVNANNGRLCDIKEVSQADNYEYGNVRTLYDGYYTNAMETYKCNWCNKWKLHNSNNNKTFIKLLNVKDSDNDWTEESVMEAATAHWTISELKHYYNSRFNNTNLTKKVKIRVGYDEDNAYYQPILKSIKIGKNYNNSSYATIDVIGHELAHKLVRETAGLKYEGESGALNESFADIFGTMAERFIRTKYNKSWNWTIAEDAGIIIRSLSTPSRYYQSEYYHDVCWMNTNSNIDHGGVHTNSGVQNKWFYNLSQSIGVDKAELIAYTTLCGYLTPKSNYHDALFASYFATISLFGKCSAERNAVVNAWNSVGISSSSIPQCGNFDNSSLTDRMSVNENETCDYVSIYPNPAEDYIFVKFSDNLSDGDVILYNHLGMIEYKGRINSNSIRIETENLSNGIHYIKVISDNQVIKTHKIIINK